MSFINSQRRSSNLSESTKFVVVSESLFSQSGEIDIVVPAAFSSFPKSVCPLFNSLLLYDVLEMSCKVGNQTNSQDPQGNVCILFLALVIQWLVT